jgi:hypothetical protein
VIVHGLHGTEWLANGRPRIHVARVTGEPDPPWFQPIPGRLPASAIVERVETGLPLEDLQVHFLDDQQRPGSPYFVAR